MNVHAGRSHDAADVDREHVVGQMGSIRRGGDSRLRIEGLQRALVELHTGDAGQRPHIDPPGVAGQHTGGPRRRDTAVVEESRGEEVHAVPRCSQFPSTLHNMKVRVARADEE